jgi:hypothetical protein
MWTSRPRPAWAAALILTLAAAGCASKSQPAAAEDAAVTTINSVCPIAGDEFDSTNVDPSHMRAWKGQKIGFCCSNCYKKFDKMTDTEKDQVLARARTNQAPE